MQHVHLNDDSYILHTSKGMTILNRKTFNFHRIKTLLKKGVEEETVLPLLVTTSMPNGIFELYLHEDTDTMMIKHIINGGIDTKWSRLNNIDKAPSASAGDSKFIGVYVSEQDIMADWPEYLL